MNESEQIIFSLVCDGYFSIDHSGRVWRQKIRGRTGRLRAVDPARADKSRKDGYRRVHVCIDKRECSALAHRLVWMSVYGDIPSGLEINHKNGIRDDNRLSNLELMTASENLLHAYRVLARPSVSGERNGRHKLTPLQVADIRLRVAAGAPKRVLAREFCVSPTAIRNIVFKRQWKDEFPKAATEASV